MTIKIDLEGIGLMPRCQLSYAIAIKTFGKSQPKHDFVDAQLCSHLMVITSRSLTFPFGKLTGAIEVKFWSIFFVTVFVTGIISESLQEQKRSIFGHFRSRSVFHFKTSWRVFLNLGQAIVSHRSSRGQFLTIFVTVFVTGTIVESLQEK